MFRPPIRADPHGNRRHAGSTRRRRGVSKRGRSLVSTEGGGADRRDGLHGAVRWPSWAELSAGRESRRLRLVSGAGEARCRA